MSIQFLVLGFELTPLEHKSPPTTTRPDLKCYFNFYTVKKWF